MNTRSANQSFPLVFSQPPPVLQIDAYADGSCQGNPGPMGIGIVLLHSTGERQEWKFYLGMGTNNIAELEAIAHALARVPTHANLVIHTDSAYSIGVLTKPWKPKVNQQLILSIKQQIAMREGMTRFVKVPGHAGILENERCDLLAKEAIQTRGPIARR